MTETGYGAGEALILALVKTATGFSSSACTRGDWKVLNGGKAAAYAILRPGRPGERIFEGHNLVTDSWTTVVEVWRRYAQDGTSLTTLEADVEAILAKIDAYPHLNDKSGYVYTSDAQVTGEPTEQWTRGGGPAWLRWIVTVTWSGQRTRTFSD